MVLADFQMGLTLSELLKNAPLVPLENRILISHFLQLSRVQLVTQSERLITEAELTLINKAFQRRLDGEPIAYIVGEREFFGLMLSVNPAVLIPRPDTELLVELVDQLPLPAAPAILDMGTGSGAIAIAISVNHPDAHLTALDASEAALVVAQSNAERHHQSRIHFYCSDWFSAIPDTKFHLIVSNPPYIEQHDHHLSEGDIRFEPIDALTDHGDGLSDIRHIIQGAPFHLYPNGWLLLEHGYDQAVAVRDLLASAGFTQVQSWKDLAGIERVSGGQLR